MLREVGNQWDLVGFGNALHRKRLLAQVRKSQIHLSAKFKLEAQISEVPGVQEKGNVK